MLYEYNLEITDGPRSYGHKGYIVADNIRDAEAWAHEVAGEFWGEADEWDADDGCWYAMGGEIAIQVYSVDEARSLHIPIYPGDRYAWYKLEEVTQ